MKEELKNIILMGLGAISMTGEKASELKKELLTKGEALYKEGMVKNEELKRDIKEKIKNSVTVEVKSNTTKEDIISAIKSMSDSEKKEIAKLLGTNKAEKVVKYNNKNKKD